MNAQQFVNYSDPGGAFTIQYPEAWEISTPADRLNSPATDKSEVDFTLEDKVTNKIAASVSVRIGRHTRSNFKSRGFENISHDNDSPSPSVVQGAHIINTSITTLSGQDAFSIRF
jgi:hypothetical protein